MNVLVTGGAGFIGAALVERLVAGGHFVAVVDDGSSGGHRLHGLHGEAAFMEADVAEADLGDFLAAAKPAAVGAPGGAGGCERVPVRTLPGAMVNVCGTVNLLQHCVPRVCGPAPRQRLRAG